MSEYPNSEKGESKDERTGVGKLIGKDGGVEVKHKACCGAVSPQSGKPRERSI